MLTLERKKKSSSSERDSEERYDNADDIMADDDMTATNSKESVDPDQISNISNELTSILKELEAFRYTYIFYYKLITWAITESKAVGSSCWLAEGQLLSEQ